LSGRLNVPAAERRPLAAARERSASAIRKRRDAVKNGAHEVLQHRARRSAAGQLHCEVGRRFEVTTASEVVNLLSSWMK
jgi:hypothetical protein